MNGEWEVKKLIEVATLQRGYDLPTRSRVSGKFPLVSSSGIIDSHNEFAVRGPGVVTGRSGSIGNVFFVEEDYWPLNTVLYVKDFNGNDPLFIFYLLKAFDLQRFATGAGVPTLNRNFVHHERVCVPSLPQQRRIVAILEQAFEGIAVAKANAEKNLQNAKALFESAFNVLTAGSEKENWVRTTVSDVAASRKGSIRTGPFGSQLLHGEFVDAGVAVLGIDNAVSNEFQWGKDRFITREKYHQLKRYRVYPEDVIITIMGTCGRCAIVPDDIPIAINTKHLCCITLDQDRCLPAYLHAYFLHHETARSYLTKYAKGSIMDGLNMGLIKAMPLLLPPLERQRHIVIDLESLKSRVRSLESTLTQKLAALDELQKSLLHQAFTGNL